MRPMLAMAILLLGLSGAAPEPDYSTYFAEYLHAVGGDAAHSPVEIESATRRGDRLAVASLQPHAVPVEILMPGNTDDADANAAASTAADSTPGHDGDVSLDDLCNAVFSSALSNDLPIPFFANLIWQESRLRNDAVSRKGALGIAQFMPQTAVETGLDNPFDPMKAIPASARFLRELRLEFGNLGFVAAAYNAGARRVAQWLEHRGSLPRETRGYVVRVTGLSVEDWRSMAVNGDALPFVRRLPCRSLPAFASVEQAQSEQVQLQQAKLEQLKLEQAQQDQAKLEKAAAKATPKPHGRRHNAAAREHGRHNRQRREAHDRRAAKREAARPARAGHDRHTSA